MEVTMPDVIVHKLAIPRRDRDKQTNKQTASSRGDTRDQCIR